MVTIDCNEQFDIQSIIGLKSVTVVNCSQSQIEAIIEIDSVKKITILHSQINKIVIERDIEKLTISNCESLDFIKFKNISKYLSIKNCNNVNIDHGYLGLDFTIENCNDLKIISSYDGAAGLIINNSKNITLPAKKIWIQYLSIENSANVTFA